MINCKKLRVYNRFTVDFKVVGGQIGCPYFTVIFLQCTRKYSQPIHELSHDDYHGIFTQHHMVTFMTEHSDIIYGISTEYTALISWDAILQDTRLPQTHGNFHLLLPILIDLVGQNHFAIHILLRETIEWLQ